MTFKSWQYCAFGSSDLKTYSNSDGQLIIQAADILNYFLEDFYFDKNVTHIHLIYFGYE